ncbi:hypothetical protein ES332_D01G184700v1 [Gossypium tomentosum]|uniref:KOW domain-containing protein n=1 Tax=Gossypium tomentosum TaxID=34277 RepID=A0A5D2MAQ4_GOSTO|nr:hypothetical protein ES332_D01G184700v1 [Gossypium tomentosum]
MVEGAGEEKKKISIWDLPDVPMGQLPPHLELQRSRVSCNKDAPIHILNKRAIEASDKERPTPDLRTGDIVEIKLEVPENRRRLSVYKGIVISKQNTGIHTTIRIRRIIAGIGVEIVFPVYSPNIKEIKVVKHRKVRRARLYYLRDKLPRLSNFK